MTPVLQPDVCQLIASALSKAFTADGESITWRILLSPCAPSPSRLPLIC